MAGPPSTVICAVMYLLRHHCLPYIQSRQHFCTLFSHPDNGVGWCELGLGESWAHLSLKSRSSFPSIVTASKDELESQRSGMDGLWGGIWGTVGFPGNVFRGPRIQRVKWCQHLRAWTLLLLRTLEVCIHSLCKRPCLKGMASNGRQT